MAAVAPKVVVTNGKALPVPPQAPAEPETTPDPEIWRHWVEPLPRPEMVRAVVEARPVLSMVKRVVVANDDVEEPMANSVVSTSALVDVAWIDTSANGDEEPTPTLPTDETPKSWLELPFLTWNRSALWDAAPRMRSGTFAGIVV